MKHIARLLFFAIPLIFLASCSSDDDALDPQGDINPERFENLEIGNADFKVPQANPDLHTQFDYTGKQKVTEIYFDIESVNIQTPVGDEVDWNISNHLIPKDYYEGQINPHVHYHVLFDPQNEFIPSTRPAEGVYKLTITVVEEDGSESVLSKEFEVVKRFFDVEVGHDGHVHFGSDELHTEFEYQAGDNTVNEITFELWFEEWREGQNVPVGSWDKVLHTLPEELYENSSNPHIHYHMSIDPEFPVGNYWLNIYVKDSGSEEAVKLSVPFSVVMDE
ncbi:MULTISPECIES: hypothetical protein [Flagellimonas]|uniref:DUF4625 domain-containing protein n=1 Tax=Flagellimonas hadalis TaxID=2597517 RepID=A0A5N5IUW7_9FLAO|nr:hypothetical protein [Allomuricauda hadalis]KAB5490825.1 hypothetical protein FOT42_005180 [Allomuricauda hadalis]